MSSILAITMLTFLNDRPTMSEVITYMDMDALLLLFSMMIVVAVLTETGVFDYLAYYAFKVGRHYTRTIDVNATGGCMNNCSFQIDQQRKDMAVNTLPLHNDNTSVFGFG